MYKLIDKDMNMVYERYYRNYRNAHLKKLEIEKENGKKYSVGVFNIEKNQLESPFGFIENDDIVKHDNVLIIRDMMRLLKEKESIDFNFIYNEIEYESHLLFHKDWFYCKPVLSENKAKRISQYELSYILVYAKVTDCRVHEKGYRKVLFHNGYRIVKRFKEDIYDIFVRYGKYICTYIVVDGKFNIKHNGEDHFFGSENELLKFVYYNICKQKTPVSPGVNQNINQKLALLNQ